jgi:hypothetical protein
LGTYLNWTFRGVADHVLVACFAPAPSGRPGDLADYLGAGRCAPLTDPHLGAGAAQDPSLRDRKFADSLLEGRVMSEPVSEISLFRRHSGG